MKCIFDFFFKNIFDSVREGNIKEVENYIAKGKDVNVIDTNGYTVVSHAVSRSHRKIVMLLLDSGADINKGYGKSSITPLIKAVSSGYDMFELLVKSVLILPD